jgi:hypothetical protein
VLSVVWFPAHLDFIFMLFLNDAEILQNIMQDKGTDILLDVRSKPFNGCRVIMLHYNLKM